MGTFEVVAWPKWPQTSHWESVWLRYGCGRADRERWCLVLPPHGEAGGRKPAVIILTRSWVFIWTSTCRVPRVAGISVKAFYWPKRSSKGGWQRGHEETRVRVDVRVHARVSDSRQVELRLKPLPWVVSIWKKPFPAAVNRYTQG